MKIILTVMMITSLFLLISNVGLAAENETFNTEKMISDLNDKIELSKEQWEKLKPVLDEKSDELKKSINEYVDKGYIQVEEMSGKLEEVSKDTEKKLEAFLNSEEMQKLKNYLNELDEDAIKEAKDRLVAELSEILALTEEQFSKLRPVMEDSMSQMSEMIEDLADKGGSGWEEFKKQYKTLTDDLKKKLQDTLDKQQMERFEEYKQEKQDKIEMAFASV
jgi:hypothetical protein